MKYLLLITLFFATTAWANNPKIGFVNTERIFKDSQPAVRAQNKLEKEFQSREQEIQKMMKQFRDLQTHMDKENMTMSEGERTKKQKELSNLSRDLQHAQREFREDVNQRRNEELAAVHERARKVILDIAEKEKFDLIVENAIYAGPKVDITDRVLKLLDK